MAKQRILFISQEIAPYLPASENSKLGKSLPTGMQERKYEVRTFMPNFGAVNERRNQLHEVIRLSGNNIVINDTDHPLIIKVASMQPSRIQVYFIDNDDYFQKSDDDSDSIGSNRADNDERVIFYARGTMETASKLRWQPDLVHASGWMSSLIPLYLKTLFNHDDEFGKSKLVYSVLRQEPTAEVNPAIFDKLQEESVPAEEVDRLRQLPFDANILHRIALEYTDAVVFNSLEADPELLEIARGKEIPMLTLDPEADNADKYHNFYQSLLG